MLITRLFKLESLPHPTLSDSEARVSRPNGGRKGLSWRKRRTKLAGESMTDRWRRFRLTGDSRHALAGGIVEIDTIRFAVDRAVVFAHEFFMIHGWAVGPNAHNLVFDVQSRRGACECVAFRGERFDVNDALAISRGFPNDRAGFTLFGRLQSPASGNDRVLGVAFSERTVSPGLAPQKRPLCVAPVAMQDGGAGDIWRALFESVRQHLAVGQAALGQAITLLNKVRNRDVAQRASFLFPQHDDQAIDVLVLARRRPEIAEMNATLVQQILPPNARVFVAALDRDAARQTSEFMASLPQKPGISLQYFASAMTLPSSSVINSFLRSNHAPCVAIIMDDVFIGPSLPDLATAIASRESLAIPRASQPMLTPSMPTPRLQTTSGSMIGSLSQEVLNSQLMPLGAVVLHEKICSEAPPVQCYRGRGLSLEEIYRRNFESMLLSERSCLDIEVEDYVSERYFFNRILLANAAPENA